MKPPERGSPLHVFITERQSRNEDFIYVQHHAKSVDLIRSNAARGMSRNAMAKIWPYRLLNLVLGHEEAK
jgi:hypothetical protein